jgi:hypothetical protein
MTFIYEKQLWCSDCRRSHYSTAELSPEQAARFFTEGDYNEQVRKHTVCGNCGGNITPHNDIDIVETKGEWKETCLECFRKS